MMKNIAIAFSTKGWGVLLFLVCFTFASLHAQTSGDYLISKDPYTYRLSGDISIHTAWELDSTARLVVWGTTGYAPNREVVNILIAHINGQQFKLTSPEARPSSAVGILPLEDRFLVVWNDGRIGGEGLYGQVVLKSGSPAGEETLLRAGGVVSAFVGSWKTEEKTIMFWNEKEQTTESSYVLAFRDDGTVDGVWKKLGDSPITGSEIYTMPGGSLFIHLKNREVVVFKPDGSLDVRKIPTGRFDVPHYHTGDTSLVVLQRKEMQFYSSYYNETPDSTIDLSSILGVQNIHALMLDSTGWFLEFTSLGFGGLPVYILSHRLYFDPSNLQDTTLIYTLVGAISWPESATRQGVGYGVSSISYLEPNVVRIVLWGYVSYDLHGSTDVGSSTSSHGYNLVGKDRFENKFIRPPRPDIRRIGVANQSAVRVIWNMPKDTTILAADIVPRQYRVNYRIRSIGTSEDTVCVKYDTTAGKVICRCYSELYSTTIDTCADDLQWRESNLSDTIHIVTPQRIRIVISGGPDGVRGTVYDRYYNVLRSDEGIPLRNFRISHGTGKTANPRGFLRPDTLFVIWEDSSSGDGMDLFGTFWKMPKWFRTEEGEVIVIDSAQTPPNLPEIEEEFLAGVRIHGISPNPTFAEAVITLETRHHEGYVDILFFDLRGREVKRLTFDTRQGKHDYLLSLSGLPEGVYEVRAVTETSIDSERLILLRKR